MSLTQQKEMQKRIRRILAEQGIVFDGSKYLASSLDNTTMKKKSMARTSAQSDVLAFGFQGVGPGYENLTKKIKKMKY
jgi:hypothetical protein